MSVGRFIFLCEPEHFDVACAAARHLLENPGQKDVVTTQTEGFGKSGATMFATRLKKSISVRQVKP